MTNGLLKDLDQMLKVSQVIPVDQRCDQLHRSFDHVLGKLLCILQNVSEQVHNVLDWSLSDEVFAASTHFELQHVVLRPVLYYFFIKDL